MSDNPDCLEMFRTGLNIIRMDSDGLPCDERQALEVTLLTKQAHRVVNWAASRDDDAARAWRAGAEAWLALFDSCRRGKREPALGRVLMWKRAGLPNM